VVAACSSVPLQPGNFRFLKRPGSRVSSRLMLSLLMPTMTEEEAKRSSIATISGKHGRGSYARFLFFLAQRFFTASDNRFLPAGVNPPRLGRTTARLPGVALCPIGLTSASKVIVRSMRSRSLFSSARILARSNVALLYGTPLLASPRFRNPA